MKIHAAYKNALIREMYIYTYIDEEMKTEKEIETFIHIDEDIEPVREREIYIYL